MGILVGIFFGGASQIISAPAGFLVDGWDTDKGLPSSTVTSIAQTPDGYLWAGTYNGLARFDGARFVTFDPASKPELGQPRVQGLFLDARGTLWINTFRGGLTSYRDGVGPIASILESTLYRRSASKPVRTLSLSARSKP